MPAPTLRPMTPPDVDAATEMILGHDWGVRREWLQFATGDPACSPFVAELDGVIVGTGVGTANGSVGWIGTIFVHRDQRGHGLGRALTQAVIDRLEAAGCRTLVLTATGPGRRLYERMGFEVQTHYRILRAPGMDSRDQVASDRGGPGPGIRRFDAADLESIVALDAEATGEDRRHAIVRFAAPESAALLHGDDGGIKGYVVRAPWGGGATVARTPELALRIIAARRLAAGPEGRVSVGILAENEAGAERLIETGFDDAWSAPRMIRGDALAWHPDWIWGQFNHAMG